MIQGFFIWLPVLAQMRTKTLLISLPKPFIKAA